MKDKRFFVNLSGILLAFAMAFGGIFAVWSRLGKERTELLSGGGEVEVATEADSLVSQSIGVVDVEMRTADLTQDQLRQAVLCLESASEKYPHEPVQGQLSMTEAIQCGMGWTENFFLPHLDREAVVPEEYRLSCYLWAGSEGEAGEGPADPLSGYWEVSIAAEEMEAVLLLNAVTGQVLQAWIALPFPAGERPDQDSLEALLKDYADSFGMEANYVISAAGDGEAGDSVHEAGSQGTEGHEAGSRGTEGHGAGSQGTEGHEAGSREPGSPEKGGGEGWGFRQRLENDRMAVCLEAGDAVSPQARLVGSGEALRFALYWETKAPEE